MWIFNTNPQVYFRPNELAITKLMIEELKTSEQWYELIPKEYGLIIYDPDGWDRENYQFSFFEELITKEEFKERVFNSTCLCKNGINEYWENF